MQRRRGHALSVHRIERGHGVACRCQIRGKAFHRIELAPPAVGLPVGDHLADRPRALGDVGEHRGQVLPAEGGELLDGMTGTVLVVAGHHHDPPVALDLVDHRAAADPVGLALGERHDGVAVELQADGTTGDQPDVVHRQCPGADQ